MKKLTIEQLMKKYSNKFIDVYRTYDYKEQKNFYEVRGVSSKIRENYNPPEFYLELEREDKHYDQLSRRYN